MDTAILALPGGWELIVVLLVVLLLFGSTKLPKLARSLGSSVTEFKKGVKGGATADADAEKLPSAELPSVGAETPAQKSAAESDAKSE